MTNMDAINTLKEYFDQIVAPTVNECLEDIYDIRRAKLAAIVLMHIGDYSKIIQFENGSPRIEYFKQVVRTIGNATKHNKLTNKTSFFPSQKNIIEGSFMNFSNMSFESTNFGSPPYIELTVLPSNDMKIVEILNGTLEMHVPIKEVYIFWQKTIEAL